LTEELESVSLTTTKPPAGLEGAPYVVGNDIDLSEITGPTEIFAGAAKEAAAAFPSNINVAIALSFAGIGPDETSVRIVADPQEENNIHRIVAEGGMGRIETEVRNVPSPTNPKTSYLAAISAIEKLRGLEAAIDIGT
jgi:aspartate dehydrogenase